MFMTLFSFCHSAEFCSHCGISPYLMDRPDQIAAHKKKAKDSKNIIIMTVLEIQGLFTEYHSQYIREDNFTFFVLFLPLPPGFASECTRLF